MSEIKKQKIDIMGEMKKQMKKQKSELIIDIVPQIKSAVSLIISTQLTEQDEKHETRLTKFKSEFYNRIPVLKEIMASREERVIVAHRQSNHEDRIENLEKLHSKGEHVAMM